MNEASTVYAEPETTTNVSEAQEPTRRSMMKTTLLTAAGAILGATLTSPAEAQSAGNPGHLNVFVRTDVSSKSLHSALDQLIPKIYGCATCGLNGPPFTFRSVEAEYGKIGANILDAVHTNPSQGKLEVLVLPQITLSTLHSALDRLLGQVGCIACGLNGFDFQFSPVEANFGNLGLTGVIATVNELP